MDALKFLQNFFQKITDVPLLEWAYFASQVRIQKFEKGEQLFVAGQSSDLIGFVFKGLAYTYYLSSEGNLYVKNFAWEGKLISPYVPIISGKVANFTAEALENTIILSITGSTLKTLQARHPCWERISRQCTEALLVQREKREYESLVLDNYQRYTAFKSEFAPIVDRIPQHIIAGYLGINPVSLSRVLQKHDDTSKDKSEIN